MKNEPTVSRPVRIVVIGAGNRANKYLEYARRYPDRLQPVAVVDVNDLRRHAFARDFGLPACRSYAHYDDFFADGVEADMVLISTPENVHFDPARPSTRDTTSCSKSRSPSTSKSAAKSPAVPANGA